MDVLKMPCHGCGAVTRVRDLARQTSWDGDAEVVVRRLCRGCMG